MVGLANSIFWYKHSSGVNNEWPIDLSLILNGIINLK